MTKNKILLGGLAAGLCLALVFTVTKFAASANNNNVPAVLQAAAAIPPAAIGKSDPPRDFGDWRLLCETPPKGAKKECRVFQRMMFGKDKNQALALTTMVHLGQVKDKQVTMIRVVTPLGTLLPPGMALKIDDGKDIKVPYLQCLPGGCLVDMVFDNDMLTKMKTGKAMFVAYRAPNGKDSTLQVSLKGFGLALDAMTQTMAKG